MLEMANKVFLLHYKYVIQTIFPS